MITSDKQLAVAQEQLVRLIAANEATPRPDIPAEFLEANQRKVEADIDRFRQDIEEYESLKKATLADIQFNSFDDLLKAPIKYRLVSHLTLDEFARKVEINVRNIQRYEASEYQSVNLNILKDILAKLQLKVQAFF